MANRVTLDLTQEIRDALTVSFRSAVNPIGFFVEPGVVAPTDDERALRDLVRQLVSAVVTTPTSSESPLFVFDTMHTDVATFYAMSMLARRDGSAEPIAPGVDDAAAALGAVVWDADPAEGEARVVCFALDEVATGYSPSR